MLIAVLPAPDDLIELRTVVQGEGVERDRVDAMLAEHATHFKVVERLPIRERLTLERDALLNLLRGTYRGARFTLSERVEAMQQMDVTLSSEMCVLKEILRRSTPNLQIPIPNIDVGSWELEIGSFEVTTADVAARGRCQRSHA